MGNNDDSPGVTTVWSSVTYQPVTYCQWDVYKAYIKTGLTDMHILSYIRQESIAIVG